MSPELVRPCRGKLRRGKFSPREIFVGENYLSPGKCFVTFPCQNVTHFILLQPSFDFFVAFNIINQSTITTGTSFTTRLNVSRLKLQPWGKF